MKVLMKNRYDNMKDIVTCGCNHKEYYGHVTMRDGINYCRQCIQDIWMKESKWVPSDKDKVYFPYYSKGIDYTKNLINYYILYQPFFNNAISNYEYARSKCFDLAKLLVSDEGWIDIMVEGVVISPDYSLCFMYNRSPYFGQLQQYKENIYNNELIEHIMNRYEFTFDVENTWLK